jgi:hypothetical protein
LLAKPIAVVPIGVVIGTVNPDPYAIPKYPVTTMKAVKFMAALRKATVFEPIAAVVLYEPAVITVLETATARSLAIKVAPRVGPSSTELVLAVPMRFFTGFGAADAGLRMTGIRPRVTGITSRAPARAVTAARLVLMTRLLPVLWLRGPTGFQFVGQRSLLGKCGGRPRVPKEGERMRGRVEG